MSDLLRKDFDLSRVYRTVNPALAFQYVSADNAPDLSVRVPTYFNNLNSWLGQTMQRDCGQVSNTFRILNKNWHPESSSSLLFAFVVISRSRLRLWTSRRRVTCSAFAPSKAWHFRVPPSRRKIWPCSLMWVIIIPKYFLPAKYFFAVWWLDFKETCEQGIGFFYEFCARFFKLILLNILSAPFK